MDSCGGGGDIVERVFLTGAGGELVWCPVAEHAMEVLGRDYM